MSNTICGLPYEVKQPTKPKYPGRTKPAPRYLVAGVTHKHGQPIRFKSLENAARHITNLKLGKEA